MTTRTSAALAVAALIAAVLGTARPAPATWSICIADGESKEVAVGTITCLTSFDLLATVPVIVVEKGGAASQRLPAPRSCSEMRKLWPSAMRRGSTVAFT